MTDLTDQGKVISHPSAPQDVMTGSVLFACTRNAIRSAMCEHLLRNMAGNQFYVDSAGVRPGENDGFVASVMSELDLDLSLHTPKSFNELVDNSFDFIITLSPEAHHHALEMTRTLACQVCYWPTMDPSLTQGNRQTQLAAYRDLRNQLISKISSHFAITQSKIYAPQPGLRRTNALSA